MEEILNLLKSLAAFNKLDLRTVTIISDVFKVNAKEMCEEHGITYFIN